MPERPYDRTIFEREGLKIDKNRILTYSQLACPLDCTYCFVDDLDYNQKRNVAYLSPEQIDLLRELPDEIELVMLGCDTEFFQDKKNAIEVLNLLADLSIDVSVITKLTLRKEFIGQVAEIAARMRQNGNILTFSVSIPCMSSASKWEPRAPSAENRIKTIKLAAEAGISTMLAMRPLLPDVSDGELEDIVVRTKDFVLGYYSGPLYLKEKDSELIRDIPDLEIEELQPHWMPDGNVFYKIERKGQMEKLKELLAQHGKTLFEGAADAIDTLKTL